MNTAPQPDTPSANPSVIPLTQPAYGEYVAARGEWKTTLWTKTEIPRDTVLYTADPGSEAHQLRHERDTLAGAIGQAAIDLGITRPDADLTGPMVLHVLRDLVDLARMGRDNLDTEAKTREACVQAVRQIAEQVTALDPVDPQPDLSCIDSLNRAADAIATLPAQA